MGCPTFLYHLAGFGLKLDRAALKTNQVGHASATVQHNLRRVLPSLQTHALVILADETLSHAMIAPPSANGPTLTDASGIYSIEETTGFNQVIYILSLVLQPPSLSKGAKKARKKSANQDAMTASK
ncbi:hypothetical protein DYB26_005968 [Aphanomyces astaci]|uniref:Uncharacterized protein n=1 Tax=Aphanomyces astaci TaxID=112090 RepID=A0A397F8S9_APHAT|nr:hypothetical protein DYB26_005968 [Aphanomyces astaci]RHZ14199.1 hypothetical protein DYB31_005947 [Aphanomyces astaci]